MSGDQLTERTREEALAALLSRAPSAVLLALDDAARRVPLPTDPDLAGRQVLPGEATTTVDIVVPEDRMVVVSTWERARAMGMAQGSVRAASDPERRLTVAFLDVRHRYGCWLGLLYPDDERTPATNADLDPSLLIPGRPRTASVSKNLYAVITSVDERMEPMLGWASSDMVGHRSLEFLHPDDHERAVAQWVEMRARRTSQRVRVRHRHRDGRWVWVEVENVFEGLDDPDGRVATAHLTDISDEMAAYEAVRAQERRFRGLAEALPVGIFQVDADQRVVYANERLTSMLDVHDAATLADQLATVHADDYPRVLTRIQTVLAGGPDDRIEARVRHAAPEATPVPSAHPAPTPARDAGAFGSQRHSATDAGRQCLFSVVALTDELGCPSALITVMDITEESRQRADLHLRATYDALTGCLNRPSILAELDRALASPAHPGVTVAYIDLDHFKAVNDTHGHATGDQLLILAARRIEASLRDNDLLARLGGDEFLVILHGAHDNKTAATLGQRLHEALHDIIVLAGHELQLAASIGLAVAAPGSTSSDLLGQADQAMYASKRTGTGPVLAPPATTDKPNPRERSRWSYT